MVTAKFEKTVDEKITSIKIDAPAAASVQRGETVSFGVAVTPQNASTEGIIWAVSNPLLATVNADGTVTMLNRTGTVILTVTVQGSNVSHSIVIRIV